MSVAYDLYASSADFVDDLTEDLARQPAPRGRHLRVAPLGPDLLRAPQALLAPAPTPLATVAVLRAPSTSSLPLRLTRRGVVVLSLLVAALGAALVWVAVLSAPAAQASSPVSGTPAAVTVHEGDTLWAIASRVAPGTDPRAEVAHLRSLNHLADPALSPGQVLRTR